MSDLPDFQIPINIQAVTLASLPIDIVAQTLGVLSIDIAAQTIGNINVNIAGSAVTLSVHETGTANVAVTSSVQLNVNIAASAITLNVHETGTANVAVTSSIQLNVNIAASAITLNVKTAVGESVDVGIISSIQLNVNLAASAITLNVHETGTANVAIASSVQLNVNLAASAITVNVHEAGTANVAIASSITLNINLAASAINVPVTTGAGEHVDIDIVSSITINMNLASSAITLNVAIQSSAVTLNVAIQSSAVTLNVAIQSSAVTLNVAIQSQAVDLNIKTSGGANIIIDRLTQSAYTERRVTISNDGAAGDFDTWAQGTNRSGKYFPRGCRGFIESIDAYTKDTGVAGGTITIYLAPYPGAGYVYTGTITIPAGGAEDWRSWTLRRPWNYDGLFIWYMQTANAGIYIDSAAPGDRYLSDDGGATFIPQDLRVWLRVALKGGTVGDVPVSGTLNTIELPNTLSNMAYIQQADINGGTTADLLATTYGMGQLVGFQARFYSSVGTVDFTQQILGIVIDGITFAISMHNLSMSVYDQTKTISPFSLAYIDDIARNIAFALNVPIKFRRSLRIYAQNDDVAGEKFTARAIYIVEKAA